MKLQNMCNYNHDQIRKFAFSHVQTYIVAPKNVVLHTINYAGNTIESVRWAIEPWFGSYDSNWSKSESLSLLEFGLNSIGGLCILVIVRDMEYIPRSGWL